MFAVIEIAGKQFQVKEQEELTVPLLPNDVGETVKFDKVLLLEKDGDTVVGRPSIKNASVSGTIVQHGRDDKIIVFKKKRRKDYKKTRGHRQDFSVIKIDSISASKSMKTGQQDNGT